jgi:bifunctional oligoribonuclease and PAP phosphatase NrnA
MLQQVLEIIRSRDRFAITSHVRPDGDALGSELALLLTLESIGKKAEVINRDAIPERYRTLPGAEGVRITDRLEETYGAVFVLECGSLDRTGLEGFDSQFVVNIDHHHSTGAYASVNWIDEDACAVGEMIYRIVKALGVSMTPEIATNIYTAIVTDTGSFQFACTTAETFRMAADLAESGADVAGIARNVFYSNPITKVNSMMVMLNRMTLECGGRVVWTAVTREDMIRHNCMEDDVEGLVNFPLTISSVDVAVFLRELEDGTFRVSLRSKNSIDVCDIAREFGGGGHRNASGCTLAGPLSAAKRLLLSKISCGIDRFQHTP